MFQLIKGARIADHGRLQEAFTATDNGLLANVSAEHILPVFEQFLEFVRDEEPLFLFMEVPAGEPSGEVTTLQQDVYYLDGCSKEQILQIMHSYAGELLIHDGLVSFGVGSLESQKEIGKYKYNIMQLFCDEQPDLFFPVFASLGISYQEEIVIAWNLFSPDNPGECFRYKSDGKDVCDLLEKWEKAGLYKAETREDD